MIDDEGQKKKIQVQFEDNENISKMSEEEELAGILENHENEILYEDSDDREENQNL